MADFVDVDVDVHVVVDEDFGVMKLGKTEKTASKICRGVSIAADKGISQLRLNSIFWPLVAWLNIFA